MDLSTAVLACLDLAAAARGLAGRAALHGHVISLQAIEPLLAHVDQAQPGAYGLVAPGGSHAPASHSLQAAVGMWGCGGGGGRPGSLGGSLRLVGRSFRAAAAKNAPVPPANFYCGVTGGFGFTAPPAA